MERGVAGLVAKKYPKNPLKLCNKIMSVIKTFNFMALSNVVHLEFPPAYCCVDSLTLTLGQIHSDLDIPFVNYHITTITISDGAC